MNHPLFFSFFLPLFACLSFSPPPPPLSVGCVRGVLASAAERLSLMCGCCVMTEGFTNMSHPSGRLVKLVQKGVRKDRMAELWAFKFGARLIWTSLKYDAAFVWSSLHGCSQMQKDRDVSVDGWSLSTMFARRFVTLKNRVLPWAFYSSNTICLSVHTDHIWTCFEMLLE